MIILMYLRGEKQAYCVFKNKIIIRWIRSRTDVELKEHTVRESAECAEDSDTESVQTS